MYLGGAIKIVVTIRAMYNQGLRICNTQTTHLPINIMTLLNIANKVIGCDTIGGAPVYGVTAQWFVDQFMEVIKLDPTASQWDEHKIYCAMCSLYLLDPQDLVWVSPFDPA
jgi:hypothetical protein